MRMGGRVGMSMGVGMGMVACAVRLKQVEIQIA